MNQPSTGDDDIWDASEHRFVPRQCACNPGCMSCTPACRSSGLCAECGLFRSDPPSKLCPACQAYQEHRK